MSGIGDVSRIYNSLGSGSYNLNSVAVDENYHRSATGTHSEYVGKFYYKLQKCLRPNCLL